MAFVKKTWKDRIVQYANRRLLTKSGGEVEQVTVTRDEGTISEAGDQFNASNMNDLEQRVKDGFDEKADKNNFAKKSVSLTEFASINGNMIDTKSFSVNDATYGIICGFAITNTPEVVVMQCYFDGTSTIYLRVRNVSASTQSYKAIVFYI